MNIELAPEAVEFGRNARRALESAGGDVLLQRAEADPATRAEVDGLLAGLGAWELDPLSSAEELEAAAELCRVCGYWAVPYPVAERLSRPRDADADALAIVSASRPAAAAEGLDLRWMAVTLDGRRHRAQLRRPSGPARKRALVAELDLEPVGTSDPPDPALALALGLVLPCWTLLGMLDRAMDLTRRYVVDRRQFDQPLARFQGVQFQLTDAEVERVGLEELAKYSLWGIEARLAEAAVDALALRLAAIEAADVVFRVTHQLHGAIGFCDETTLSWISRYSVPLRRLPTDLAETSAELTRRLGSRPLAGMFARAETEL